MKNLSILQQITIINIIIMALFMGIFITENYKVVTHQLVVLEDEKIDAIVKTLRPIIAINLSLGLKNNYIESVEKVMNLHNVIVGIEILNNGKDIIYKNYKNEFNDKKTKVYEITLEDTLLETPLGSMKVYYTFSNIYSQLLGDFLHFLFKMFLFFIIALIAVTFLIKLNLDSLQTLKEKMLNYKLNDKTEFKKIPYKNEVAIINNAAIEMLTHIEKEVETRILYEKQIMQKTRLASMGEMLDNIAHQWRQPLMKMNGILLNIDRKNELHTLDKAYLKQKIDEASNTTQHMSQTIETFRNFISPNKAKQNFNIIEAVKKSLEFLHSSLLNVSVIFKYDKQYNIYGMENEFLQVLISILTNAIEMLVQRVIENKLIIINVYTEDASLVIAIEDNAKGIDKTILETIFDPYFTTKYKSGGTGMGLYISKLLITKSFNGTISVVNGTLGAKFLLKIEYPHHTSSHFADKITHEEI